jgi:hypothetical protein
MLDVNEQMDTARRFVRENLLECATELLALFETGILPAGRIRAIADHLQAIDAHQRIEIIKSLVQRFTLEAFVEDSPA